MLMLMGGESLFIDNQMEYARYVRAYKPSIVLEALHRGVERVKGHEKRELNVCWL